ncbi:hypothetical protein DQ238_04405 [Geodermatophilus sp. TF02-6]|uniref:DMT family transporter n=1 Tax=Geodermatophilus sp. TF02-6 TaxID=2250575 RepID=UPI000DEAC554|nr:DMT family transporter [Geodermatophilus sp. TF02-6]RBY82531.1 hypothetical protein DQ238_04405 [Geodermatophilus sp. TF02-6]
MAAAVLLALASAATYAVSTVLQHSVAAAPALRGRGALSFAAGLLRHPAWLLGQAAAALGLVLHALALRFGPVVIVAPLLSTGLVFGLVLGALVDRRHPDRRLPDRGQWVAAGVVVVGLALFTASADPRGGRATAPPAGLAVCVLAALLVAGAAMLWARRPTAPSRATVLGVAAGTGFGITGLLLKEFVGLRPAAWPTSWTTPALVVVGGIAVYESQRAFQAGPLIASLPVMTVLEPLVSTVLAGPLYSERLAPGPLASTAQLVGAPTLAVGLFVLARCTARASPAVRGTASDRNRAPA